MSPLSAFSIQHSAFAPLLAQSNPATDALRWQLPLWYLIAFVSLTASALFSGTEIGIYSLSKIRLRLRVAKKNKNALLLSEYLLRPTYVLEGLLILQNITSFAFAASITRILSLNGFSDTAQTLISIAIVTPSVLIFADIMPKDLFHTHADAWIYRLVPLLKWMFRALTIIPLLPLVNLLSKASTALVRSRIGEKTDTPPAGPRAEILTLFQESAATGVLTGTQQDLVQRALRLGRISVREVMIPWNRVVGVPVNISYEGFRALVKHYNVSRMPVLGRSTTEVLGIIDVIDALTPPSAQDFRHIAPALAGKTHDPALGGGRTPDLSPAPAGFKISAHLHPAMTLIAEQNVRSAITLMQRARQTIAIVVDRQNRAIGLVTMKDLIEELVGDLENW